MTRILIAVGIALLLSGRAWAQSEANCDEIRQAVATYGYEEARRHALIHYGPEAVEAGEKKCLIRETPAKEVATKPAPKHPHAKQAKKHKPTTPSVHAKQKSSAQAQQGETPRPPRTVP